MNTNLSKSGGVFPDEETFQRVYDECMEDAPPAPQKLQDAYKAMRESFEQYLVEIDEYTFRIAYQRGYEAGRGEGMSNNDRLNEIIRLACEIVQDIEKKPFLEYEQFRLEAPNYASSRGLLAQQFVDVIFMAADRRRRKAAQADRRKAI